MPVFAKGGPHLRLRTPQGQVWARNCHYVKAVDDASLLDDGPQAETIFRQFMGDGESQWQGRNGATVCQGVIGRLGGRRPTWIEGPNECGLDENGNLLPGFLQFWSQFIAEAHRQGFHVAAFSFSNGRPQLDQWIIIAQANWCGMNAGDVLGIHEYWDNAPPFPLYTALRHQLVHQTLVNAGYPNHPPFLITECNYTDGWKGPTGNNANVAASVFQQYDAILAGDPTVVGELFFTNGASLGNPNFPNFEIDDLAPVLWPGTPSPNPNPNPNPAPAPDPGPAPSGGLSPMLAIGVGIALGVVALALMDGFGGGQPNTITVTDVRTIAEGSPVPPGWVQVDL